MKLFLLALINNGTIFIFGAIAQDVTLVFEKSYADTVNVTLYGCFNNWPLYDIETECELSKEFVELVEKYDENSLKQSQYLVELQNWFFLSDSMKLELSHDYSNHKTNYVDSNNNHKSYQFLFLIIKRAGHSWIRKYDIKCSTLFYL